MPSGKTYYEKNSLQKMQSYYIDIIKTLHQFFLIQHLLEFIDNS